MMSKARLHVELTPEEVAQFDEIKRRTGARSRAEVIRRAVNLTSRILDAGGVVVIGGEIAALEVV